MLLEIYISSNILVAFDPCYLIHQECTSLLLDACTAPQSLQLLHYWLLPNLQVAFFQEQLLPREMTQNYFHRPKPMRIIIKKIREKERKKENM